MPNLASPSFATSLYALPAYYDIVFGETAEIEYEFLRDCFSVYAKRKVHRVYEPACGSGRLLVRFARDSYSVTGCDLSPAAITYCRRRLQRFGSRAVVARHDMRNFRPPLKADAAFNLISSIQHLADDDDVLAHLHTVAASLRLGGLYVFGLQLLPSQGRRITSECWSGQRGGLQVTTALRTTRLDRRRRIEHCRMSTRIVGENVTRLLEETLCFRTYTCEQMSALLARAPELQVVATYDFNYDITTPVPISRASQDVIYVLRRE